MNSTLELHNGEQSLWPDNITRDLLDNGTLMRYFNEFSITGLRSKPTIFEHAISKSKSYDSEIGRLLSSGLSGEELFFELALQGLTLAGAPDEGYGVDPADPRGGGAENRKHIY